MRLLLKERRARVNGRRSVAVSMFGAFCLMMLMYLVIEIVAVAALLAVGFVLYILILSIWEICNARKDFRRKN